SQPIIRTLDAFGNNSSAGLPASLNLSVTLTSGTGPLQGTMTLDLGTGAGNGIVGFSDLRIDAAGTNKQLTASAPGLSSAASSFFSVSPGPASRLTLQSQPSAAATAGVAFNQQPVVRIEDAFGNLRSSDNSTVVNTVRNLGSGTLQGTTTATASGGVASFTNLSYTVAETIKLN